MPYDSRIDLPKGVRDNLPAHAQDISKETYHGARDEYDHAEPSAHRVAWGAVGAGLSRGRRRGMGEGR